MFLLISAVLRRSILFWGLTMFVATKQMKIQSGKLYKPLNESLSPKPLYSHPHKSFHMVYLVFLPTFALLFNLLLFLELLSDAGLAQRLTFAALVGLSVEGSFQSSVTTHANHHLLTQLWAQKTRHIKNRIYSTVDDNEQFNKQRLNMCTVVYPLNIPYR